MASLVIAAAYEFGGTTEIIGGLTVCRALRQPSKRFLKSTGDGDLLSEHINNAAGVLQKCLAVLRRRPCA